MTHERMPIYRKYRACGLPGSWAMRLEKNRSMEKAFRDAHPPGLPIRYTQANGYRLADWVLEFFGRKP